MRLATIRTGRGTRAARLEGDAAIFLDAVDVGELLRHPDWRAIASSSGPAELIDTRQLAPPVVRPDKILCVGRNFENHAAEAAMSLPRYPSLFAKFARSLAGPYDDLVLPHRTVSVHIDWEVELALVVGQPVRNATPEEAEKCIAGYMIANDVSVRDWQLRSPTVTAGKAWESLCPVGPWITTADALDFRSMQMRCTVNDTLMQDSFASEMIFSPSEVVSYASCILTLDPGDVVLLGSPAGTAFGRNPSPWLKPGMTLRTAISGLGELMNVCTEGTPGPHRWVAVEEQR